ncbi:MAG: Prephenate dehydrogenase-like protein [Actinomycetia bacterium]|nr:Prephenate dehydrogenase-like protein [Actinomycetes bacterium]
MSSAADRPLAAGAPAPASVIVIGTGLIGTSVALALRPQGVTVWLADSDPAAARLAADIGAGTVLPGDVPAGPPPGGPADVAVLAVPPQAVAPALARAQAAGLARWYTDVASVKTLPVRQARAAGCDMASFVPGHPLSGRERSGPAAARADLFLGRPWVICPDPPVPAAGLAAIGALARTCGAEPAEVSAAGHDRWVALVSHAPHVLSAAMAARLADASDGTLSLAGQGLRDVTRIAAGDTGLWTQILAANAAPVADVLAAVAADLAAVAEALADTAQATGASPGTGPGTGAGGGPDLKVLAALLEQGGAGVARIPGKRGAPARAEAAVQVVIPDRPGELARLFQAAGEAGVNIEDIGIEHSPGLPVGVAELTVHPEAVGRLTEALAANGWPVRR